MAIDPKLLAVLACPSDDHAELREESDELVCVHCASRYLVLDGVPVLLMDDATPGPHGFGQAAASDEQ
jgi:uncharacterized protein YbaR (Trm112 family)